jgi:hypothetical protein
MPDRPFMVPSRPNSIFSFQRPSCKAPCAPRRLLIAPKYEGLCVEEDPDEYILPLERDTFPEVMWKCGALPNFDDLD